MGRNFQVPHTFSFPPIEIKQFNGYQDFSSPDPNLTSQKCVKHIDQENGTNASTATKKFKYESGLSHTGQTRCSEKQTTPVSLIFDLQARGELLAQPLIPQQEFESFFEGLEKSLKFRAECGNTQGVTLARQEVTRARLWLTYPFLGIVQLQYDQSGPIHGKKGLLSLPDAVIEAWGFLKDILTHWLNLNHRQPHDLFMSPLEASESVTCLDAKELLEELQSYMHTQWEINKCPPDSHLWKLFERWSILRTKESTMGWDAIRYRAEFDKLHMISGLPYLNPCLQNHGLESDPQYRKLYKRLQSRGEFIIESLWLTEELELVSEETHRLLRNSSHISTLELIKKGFTRIKSWTSYRFLGAIQLIFVQKRLHSKKTRVSTLQEEITDGLFFLKQHFKGFGQLHLQKHSWIFSKHRGLNSKLIDWSDHAQVFAHYMHHPTHNYPNPGHFLHLLYIWLSQDITSKYPRNSLSNLSKFLSEQKTFGFSLGISESNPPV